RTVRGAQAVHRAAAARAALAAAHRPGRARPVVPHRRGRDRRLYRAERRREVDHHQDAHRDPDPDRRAGPGGRGGTGAGPGREGRDLWRRGLGRPRGVGVVSGQRPTLWWALPLRDSFELLRRLYRVGPAEYRSTLDRLVGLLDLGPLLDTPVRQLSLGQRMRGDLAAALVHSPRILYLDEPA